MTNLGRYFHKVLEQNDPIQMDTYLATYNVNRPSIAYHIRYVMVMKQRCLVLWSIYLPVYDISAYLLTNLTLTRKFVILLYCT